MLWLIVSILFFGLGIIVSTVASTEEKSNESILADESFEEVVTEEQTEKYSELDMTLDQENTLNRASFYMSLNDNKAGLPYSGLIFLLVEAEGFTKEDATFAADNCVADWNEQAAYTAEYYYYEYSLSYEETIDQLPDDGFTKEEEEYGMTAIGY